MAELALDHVSDTPSRAISTAWAWRSWCGAKRRRTPVLTAKRRNWVRTEGADHGWPAVGPLTTQNRGQLLRLEAYLDRQTGLRAAGLSE